MESAPELQQFWLILKRRWRPAAIAFTTVIGLTGIAVALTRPTYEAEGRLLFQYSNSAATLTQVGREIGELRSLYGRDPMDTELEKLRSVSLVQKTIEALELRDDEGNLLKPETFIEKNLKLKKLRGTDIMLVAYRSKDAEQAARVVNQLIHLYLDKSIQTEQTEASAAYAAISRQLPKTEATLRQAEIALRQFKEVNNVVDLGQESSQTVVTVEDLRKRLSASRIELQSVDARSGLLRSQLGFSPKQALQVSALSQTPGVQKALEELQDLQTQLANAQGRYLPNHPAILTLQDRIKEVQALIQERSRQVLGQAAAPGGNWQTRGLHQDLMADYVKLQANRLDLQAQIAGLDKQYLAYSQRMKILPRLEQELRRLQSQLDAAKYAYEILLKKLQEVRLAESQSVQNAQILESAKVPEKFLLLPYAFKILLGLMLGSSVFLGVILLLELRDRSIKTVREARELLDLTLLGVIPAFSKTDKRQRLEDNELMVGNLIVRDQPRSPISEAYRMLHSNLRFMNSDGDLKVIAVTSSIPGEGKSTTCANLAIAMAQRGCRVLLIDADMRVPTQHHFWQLTNAIGLSEVIVGQTDLPVALNPVLENLDVLTAGVIPPNPGALLDSKRMATLVQALRERYDFILLDSPALNVADDPRILSQLADGVLLVVRPGVVSAAQAQASKELLSQTEQKILGLVVNGVVSENGPYAHYYRGADGQPDGSTLTSVTGA
uniref:non-specific protein-tyrosine kinase n=1 Tax=Cyanothece sp. (strain PCC 7425 / ATCC 29141) TaxID=395961 RepID=B8HLM3_CYAP4